VLLASEGGTMVSTGLPPLPALVVATSLAPLARWLA